MNIALSARHRELLGQVMPDERRVRVVEVAVDVDDRRAGLRRDSSAGSTRGSRPCGPSMRRCRPAFAATVSGWASAGAGGRCRQDVAGDRPAPPRTRVHAETGNERGAKAVHAAMIATSCGARAASRGAAGTSSRRLHQAELHRDRHAIAEPPQVRCLAVLELRDLGERQRDLLAGLLHPGHVVVVRALERAELRRRSRRPPTSCRW